MTICPFESLIEININFAFNSIKETPNEHQQNKQLVSSVIVAVEVSTCREAH